MSLDQVTNIAQIAAALATVITLAYLAIQIRSNNNLQKAESRRSVLSHSAQLATAIGQSSDSSDCFLSRSYRVLAIQESVVPMPLLEELGRRIQAEKDQQLAQ